MRKTTEEFPSVSVLAVTRWRPSSGRDPDEILDTKFRRLRRHAERLLGPLTKFDTLAEILGGESIFDELDIARDSRIYDVMISDDLGRVARGGRLEFPLEVLVEDWQLVGCRVVSVRDKIDVEPFRYTW